MILKWTSFLKISGKILGFDFWFVFSFGPSRRTRVRKIINHFFIFIFSVSMFVLYVLHFSVYVVVMVYFYLFFCFYVCLVCAKFCCLCFCFDALIFFSIFKFVWYVLHFSVCAFVLILLFLFYFCLTVTSNEERWTIHLFKIIESENLVITSTWKNKTF